MPQKTSGSLQSQQIDLILAQAAKIITTEKQDQSCLTEKEPSLLDFSTPNNSIIRGLMNKVKTLNSEKTMKKKSKLIEQNVIENLIVKKIEKPSQTDFKLFKTEIKEELANNDEQLMIKIKEDNEKDGNSKINSNKTLPILKSFFENNFSKLDQTFNDNRLLERNKKLIEDNIIKREVKEEKEKSIINATEAYKAEFKLQTQLKGLKKIPFADIQGLWEEVINRRILEGENDKISIYLRGYLGTDKFESEKARIIAMMGTAEVENLENTPQDVDEICPINKNIQHWKEIVEKYLSKQFIYYKPLINPNESPKDILYKIAKNLKFVKHRLEKMTDARKKKKISIDPGTIITYSADKWSVKSISLTPVEADRGGNKRKKYFTRKDSPHNVSRAKTQMKEKITGDNNKLPYI